MKTAVQFLLYTLVGLLIAGCGKEFLDVKRDKSQVVPATLADFQAMLDNTSIIHFRSGYPLNSIGSDEYFVSSDVWELLSSAMQRNAYIWAPDIFEGAESTEWNYAYERILYANTVLDGLAKLDPEGADNELRNRVWGSALFMRAYTFYQLAHTFAPPYDARTAATAPGIPLRLEMDITEPVKRASLEETFRQIIEDLEKAVPLLPLHSDIQIRPIRQAAYALLAKVHMHRGDYQTALNYADSCINFSEGLLDYNGLDLTARYTFAPYSPFSGTLRNPEILYTEVMPGATIQNNSRFCINEELYALYEDSDIRKEAFFFPTRDTYTFKGSYIGVYNFFGGVALDEVVLLRAECFARLGDTGKALEDINYFLANRYKEENFVPVTIQQRDDIIKRIIEERRKELLCRGIRWEDLRRFNKEDAFGATLTRTLNGETYTLPPNDPRYTWPIPNEVIRLSGIPQNPR